MPGTSPKPGTVEGGAVLEHPVAEHDQFAHARADRLHLRLGVPDQALEERLDACPR
jgi:hypothetical protein